MAKRKVSEMSLEELELYREQLSQKLAEVNFYLRKKTEKARGNSANSESQNTSSKK